MINYLSGTVAEKGARHAVLDVQGVGYAVFTTDDCLQRLKLGALTKLKTRHVVREDSEELFGFLDDDDLRLFELLLSVPGIGPKTALNILNVATAPTLRRSITSGETAYLTKISGIGKKTAEKIVLELREKLGKGEEGTTLKEEVDALEVNLLQADERPNTRDGSGLIVDETAEQRIARFTEADPMQSDLGAESVEPAGDDTSDVLRRHHPNTSIARSDAVVEGNLDEPNDETVTERKADEGTAG